MAEGLYLLCSIASNFLTSSLLSLILAVRSLPLLFRSISPSSAGELCSGDVAAVRVYEGRVHHSRAKPVVNSFEYPVRYALFDLDRSPQPSHLSADGAREAAGTDGPVFLLTIPASVGYEQNPLRVYYCYCLDREGEGEGAVSLPRLKSCVAEVTNTPWGEKVFFVFCPGSDLVAKPLHVSPFMDMLGNWIIHADEPCEELFISITVQHPILGNYFTATLSAKSVHSSTSLNLAMYFWLMPHKVAVWIYWQAVKLWWRNVPFIGHPKYSNPNYRDEALTRDHELCFLGRAEQDGNHPNQNSKIGVRKAEAVALFGVMLNGHGHEY